MTTLTDIQNRFEYWLDLVIISLMNSQNKNFINMNLATTRITIDVGLKEVEWIDHSFDDIE